VDDVGGGFDEHRLDVGVGMRDPVPGRKRSRHAGIDITAGDERRVRDIAEGADVDICDPAATHEGDAEALGVVAIRAEIVRQEPAVLTKNRRSREEDIKMAARRIDRRPFPEAGTGRRVVIA
jgi:hypothetical protein